MKHIEDIRGLLHILLSSGNFHSLILEGAPGWGKSSSIERLLQEKGISFVALGSYTTPLSLFKFLSENPKSIVVIDDCAGIFGDSIAMSILKAATWPSSGSEGTRLITWSTTSDRSEPAFFFEGKIVLLTNMVPKSGDGAAFTSRSLHYCIAPGPTEMEGLLRSVACSPVFSDCELAKEVADLLIAHSRTANFNGINLRTLRLGYELAQSKMSNWRELFQRLLPAPDPFQIAYLSTTSGGSVEEQFKQFHRVTGLSRRTFFYYKSREKQP